MAGLLRPSGILLSPRRLLLPGGGLSIDRSHPLSAGLLACYLPGLTRGIDISGNVPVLPLLGSAPLTQACPEGIAYLNNGTTQSSWGGIVPPSNMLGLNQMTFYVRWQQTGTGIGTAGTGVHLALWDITNGNVVGLINSGTGGQILAKGESNITGLQTGNFAPTVGIMQSATSTYVAGGVLSIYHNGVFSSSTAQAAAPTGAGTWNIFLCGGVAGSATPPQQVGMYIAACWNRALSASEIVALDQDPYAFITPDEAFMPSLNLPAITTSSFFGQIKTTPPKRLPPGPNLTIDWSHPLTRGLIGAFVPGVMGGVNLTGQCPPLAIKTATDTRKTTQEGPSWTTTADSAGLFGASCPAAFKTWTQFSIYWRGFFTSYTTNNTKVFGIEFDNIGSTPFAVASLGYGGSTGTNFVAEWNTAGTYTHDVGVALTAGMQGMCGTFKVGGNVVLYKNGIVVDTTAFGASNPTNAGSSLINFQTANGNAGNFSGSGNVGYMWNRELSAAEVTLLDSDPYAFLLSDASPLPGFPGSALTITFDVADNPAEPLTLQYPNLSPAQSFIGNTSFWQDSQDNPSEPLDHPTPNLSPAQPFAIRIENPTPTNQWWDQPPDLQRHPQQYDPNQSRLSYQDKATPTAFGFWTEPIDLEKHPTQIDPNQARVSYQDLATPDSLAFYAEPPSLLWRPQHLDTNQPDWYNETFLEPATWWWSQPTALLWHPPQLDTNESRLVSQQFAEPAVWWYTEPPDLQFHPTHLDTNQSRIVNPTGWTPTAFFLLPQIDVQKHPPELFGNQPFVTFPQVLGLTPLTFGFWAQPLDLHRHPPHLDTNQQRLVYPDQWTPSSFGFWTEPVDLQRHATHLDTNQAFVFLPPLPGATPGILGFWAQPPDLLRHAASLDTNLSRVSFQNLATPSAFGFWAQPPDLMRHPPTLDTNEFRLVSQQFAEPGVWWWTQPQFQPPRAPDLWAGQPYVAQGWQLTANGLFVPVPAFLPPRQPNLTAMLYSAGFVTPVAVTPGPLAFFHQPYLLAHPRELITWQQRVGLVIPPPNATPGIVSFFGQPQDLLRMPPAASILPWTYVPGSFRFEFGFFGSAFIAAKSRLSQPSTKPRYNISAKGVSSLTSTNRIMQGFRKMSRSPDLSPPIVAGVEQEYVQFDFAPGLNPGIIIASIVAVNVYSLTGNDPTPMARLLNTPAITASPSSLAASQGVVGLFGNMVAGLYLLQAIIQTSDGQVLSTEARWPCVSATP